MERSSRNYSELIKMYREDDSLGPRGHGFRVRDCVTYAVQAKQHASAPPPHGHAGPVAPVEEGAADTAGSSAVATTATTVN